jgi:MMP 1-O-methyltransferase
MSNFQNKVDLVTLKYANNTEMKAVREVTRGINGWLTDAEKEFLYNAAKHCTGKGVIVEIGSWKGKSTICLAKGSKAGNNVKVYAIDPHTGSSRYREKYGDVWSFEEFKENIRRAGVEDIVIPIVKTSENAARDWDGKPVELLWIDGAHEYEMVKLDFDLWSPYLIEGGIIAFHDTIGWPGSKKVVKENIYKSHNFANVGFIGSLTYARKVRANSLAQRLRNHWVLLLAEVCELGVSLRLPEPVKKLAKRVVRFIQ